MKNSTFTDIKTIVVNDKYHMVIYFFEKYFSKLYYKKYLIDGHVVEIQRYITKTTQKEIDDFIEKYLPLFDGIEKIMKY